jgi:hypothetical protein
MTTETDTVADPVMDQQQVEYWERWAAAIHGRPCAKAWAEYVRMRSAAPPVVDPPAAQTAAQPPSAGQ